jgi:hypothetical protein
MKKETITLNPDTKKFILKLTNKTTLTEQDIMNSFVNDYYDYLLERNIDVEDLIYADFNRFKK